MRSQALLQTGFWGLYTGLPVWGLERCRVSDGGQLLLLDDSYACHGLHSAPT